MFTAIGKLYDYEKSDTENYLKNLNQTNDINTNFCRFRNIKWSYFPYKGNLWLNINRLGLNFKQAKNLYLGRL